MGGKKKKRKPEETPIIDPDFPPPMEEATSGGTASEGVDLSEAATSGGNAAEGVDPTSDATSGGSAAESLDDILADLGDENSPLIPDPVGEEEAMEAALANEAIDAAKAEAQANADKKGGLSSTAAKRKAEKEKKKANKLAAIKAESADRIQKEKIKRQRTVASQQNKTARERILRGETGARGRMYTRINAKFRIPDAPVNFPPTGGSGTQFN